MSRTIHINIIVKISYYDLLGNSKKNLIKRGKKCQIYIIVKISYYNLLNNSKKNLMKKGKKC